MHSKTPEEIREEKLRTLEDMIENYEKLPLEAQTSAATQLDIKAVYIIMKYLVD